MTEWFVLDRGQRSGPFPTAVVVQKVVNHEVPDGALVWREGMSTWEPLPVHFKKPTIPAASADKPTTSLATANAEGVPPRKSSPSSRNFLVKFWRGGYPLSVSFWVVGLFGNLSVWLLCSLFAESQNRREFDPYVILVTLGVIWAVSAIWGTFQFVGIWRAATSYRKVCKAQSKSQFWGVAAQLVVVIGAIALASDVLTSGAPQLTESWRVAFQGDPDIPNYTIRVMRNGTEMEIAGGLKYGLASDVKKVVAASPQIRTVHLNSVGGRIGEAEKLAQFIRAHGLTTYTSSQCLSACTIAFAAGKQRWLKVGAKLGYHSASFAGRAYPEEMRRALLEAGLDSSFVTRAVSYSSDHMWYPTLSELLGAKVISGSVDDYAFAASGYGIRPGSEDFKRLLRQHSYFRALEAAAPKVFASMANEYQQAYIAGTPQGKIFDDIRDAQIAPVVAARLATADGGMAMDFAALLADEYEALGNRDARSCYEYASGRGNTNVVRMLPEQLTGRELAITEKLLRSAPVRDTLPQKQLEGIYEKVFQRLAQQYGMNTVMLLATPEKLSASHYSQYCRLATAMFRQIARLPRLEAGFVLRDIFKDRQAISSK